MKEIAFGARPSTGTCPALQRVRRTRPTTEGISTRLCVLRALRVITTSHGERAETPTDSVTPLSNRMDLRHRVEKRTKYRSPAAEFCTPRPTSRVSCHTICILANEFGLRIGCERNPNGPIADDILAGTNQVGKSPWSLFFFFKCIRNVSRRPFHRL